MNNVTGGEKPHAAQPLISATIICKNEVEKIRGALKSVRFCDEVIVVDSGSTDGTLKICHELADRVIERGWPGHVAQKNFALAAASGEWVLSLDADERVTPELAEEIKRAAASGQKVDGYAITRHVHYLGRWINHSGWFPEYRVRLVRQGKALWGGINPHDELTVEGRTAQLKGEIVHYTYDDMSGHVNTMNHFSSLFAVEHDKNKRRFSWLTLLTRPPLEFVRKYFLRRGFLDGSAGFMVAALSAVYMFLRFAKLWELQNVGEQKPWLDDGE